MIEDEKSKAFIMTLIFERGCLAGPSADFPNLRIQDQTRHLDGDFRADIGQDLYR